MSGAARRLRSHVMKPEARAASIASAMVVGTRKGAASDPDSWRVLLLVVDFGIEQVELSPAEAERLAASLIEMAAVCRREHGALEQRLAEQVVSR